MSPLHSRQLSVEETWHMAKLDFCFWWLLGVLSIITQAAFPKFHHLLEDFGRWNAASLNKIPFSPNITTKLHPLNTYFQQEKKTCWHLKWFLWHPFLWSKHLWSQVKLFQPDRSSAPLSFSELPGWMGNAAASPRIHSPTREKPNPGENGGWLVLFGGPMLWGDFGKKNMGETLGKSTMLEKVTHF